MIRLAISSTLLIGILLLLHFVQAGPAVAYTAVFIAASAMYLLQAREISSGRPSRRSILFAAIAALLVRGSFLFTLPVGSDDVYRYIWDGKVQSAGVNPYQFAPDAPELRYLHSSRLPGLVNHPDMKTLYFPASQWVFLLGYQISGEEIWGYKLLLLLAEMATIAGLFLLTAHTGIPWKFVLLYALCPLPVMAFAVDAHLDGFGLPLIVFGLLLHLRGKKAAALLLFALSISVKPVALVFLPVLFVLEKGLWQKARTLLIPLVVLLLQFVPYSVSASPLDSLEIFAKHWAFNGSVFELVNLYLADNQKARYVCAFLLGFAILLLSLSRKELMEKIYLSVFLLLLFSPVVHPWYVSWLAVLLPLARRWSGLSFVSAVSLALFTVVAYKTTGVWTQYPLLLLLEYLPTIGLLGLELRGSLPPLPLEPGA